MIGTGWNYADPGVPGGELEGLYYVKNIRKAMEWDKVISATKSAVVVEAGPLGLEMVTALAHRGVETHLIDPNPYALSMMADPDIMAPVEESWRELGVHLHFNTTLEEFLGDGGKVRAVKTSGGEIAADLVVISTHKTPNNALAEAAGIKIGSTGGIIVDERMTTSAPDVWAAGDATEIPHGLTRTPLQGLTGSHAYAQGKTAGTNAGGGDRAYRAVYVPWGTPAGKWVIGGASFGETTATALGIPYVLGTATGDLPGAVLPGGAADHGEAAGRAGHPAADRGADDRRWGGHQGTRRLPGPGDPVRDDLPRPLDDGERLLPGHRRAQRADRRRGHQRPRRSQEGLTAMATSAGFAGWLRTNSEHYLLIAAHRKLARTQGAPGAAPAARAQGDLLAAGLRARLRSAAVEPAQPHHAHHAGQPPQDVGTTPTPSRSRSLTAPSDRVHHVHPR